MKCFLNCYGKKCLLECNCIGNKKCYYVFGCILFIEGILFNLLFNFVYFVYLFIFFRRKFI